MSSTPARASHNDNPESPGSIRPLWSLKIGSVEAAIWPKRSEKGSPSVSVHKSYTDSEGHLQNTQTFFLEDLPSLTALSQLATAELAKIKQQSRGRLYPVPNSASEGPERSDLLTGEMAGHAPSASGMLAHPQAAEQELLPDGAPHRPKSTNRKAV
jgi:hypothetical protein